MAQCFFQNHFIFAFYMPILQCVLIQFFLFLFKIVWHHIIFNRITNCVCRQQIFCIIGTAVTPRDIVIQGIFWLFKIGWPQI